MIAALVGRAGALRNRASLVRLALAAGVTFGINALIAFGLALWHEGEGQPQQQADDPPIVLATIEPARPPTPQESSAPEEPEDASVPAVRPRPVPAPDVELYPPVRRPTALPVAPALAADLSAWSPSLDFSTEAPEVSPPPARSGAEGITDAQPGSGQGDEEAPAPRGPSRAAVLREPPPLEHFYPRRAERRRINGTTSLRLRIDRTGRVTEARVLESKPSGIFDQAAVRAARRMRYDPALQNGRPVPATVVLKFIWKVPE